ncbi:hypothetical protein [uncultured Dubosiella sp.]|jgi:hypothetical protein|uniref:hypothetical protein n=1 Tax=uncultured Dubosiella sp. TaxID=1937011 RepID=UPI002622512B|nr:hypothetical protein [uncultured Dubosiella sp.]
MVQLTRYQCVRNLMKNGKRSIDESMDILEIPEDDQPRYREWLEEETKKTEG